MNNRSQCGVYRWLNTITEESYVGSSNNLNKRKGEHLRDLVANRHHSPKFQNAWNKYGMGVFKFEPLSYCPESELLSQEQFAINTLNAVKDGYNVALVAGSPMRGRKMSQEAKDAISKKTTGRKYSLEHNEKIKVALTGRQFSPETLSKMSAAQRGKPHPWALGKGRNRHSAETCELIGNSVKNSWRAAERRSKATEYTDNLYRDAFSDYLKHPTLCWVCGKVILPKHTQKSKRWVSRLVKRIYCSRACANKARTTKPLLEKVMETGA